MSELCVGLISGTSMDGVDAVLAELDDTQCRIHGARTFVFPPALAQRLRSIIETPQIAGAAGRP
jgi:1,6-anhydro-N-acetylmuramate kinase